MSYGYMAIAIYISKITHLQPYNIDNQPEKTRGGVMFRVLIMARLLSSLLLTESISTLRFL